MRRSGSSAWSWWSSISQPAGIRGGGTAVVVLLTAGLLGATMSLPWWRRGRKGLYGDNDPAGFYPLPLTLEPRPTESEVPFSALGSR